MQFSFANQQRKIAKKTSYINKPHSHLLSPQLWRGAGCGGGDRAPPTHVRVVVHVAKFVEQGVVCPPGAPPAPRGRHGTLAPADALKRKQVLRKKIKFIFKEKL